MKVLGVIPARFQSSRMPGKPIADILGRPMIWWVYQQVIKNPGFSDVVVATDDERIVQECDRYGMKSIMTSVDHETPTSRLYEVSTKIDADLYMLIMGDEPLVDERSFSLVMPERFDGGYYVGALTNLLTNPTDVIDFSNQKVVTNSKRETLLISRSPIPYPRGTLDLRYEKVTGVQIFSKKALRFFNSTKRSILEKAEENDLMRFVENGIPVKMTVSNYKTISVDTPKDLEKVKEILAREKSDDQMNSNDLMLLDCTLRDGGYVNEWRFGSDGARNIIKKLTKANIDVVEVGFLRNVEGYDPDVTVCNHIEELNKLLPSDRRNTIYSAMAMRSNYDIDKLTPYNGKGIEMIRITAHDYDIEDGMDFAREVKAKGYKLSINPINIMGYSDARILWIIDQVNQIGPYQFAIVDTFGSMKRRDLDRIVSLVDNNLDKNIRVSLHLHENMSLSSCLAQAFIDKHLNRPIAVDGSLMGMGRIPGNLPIELIADYCNDYAGKTYDIDYLMDAIQDHIAPIKGSPEWGYTPVYFLSARFNLHRNYAEHYLKKGDLTNKDINHILSQFDPSKKTAFDAVYADRMYEDYKNKYIDDAKDWDKLSTELKEKDILLIAPGSSIVEKKDDIEQYIRINKVIVIGVNCIPTTYQLDYAFFCNNRRFTQIDNSDVKTIITSNLTDAADYRINYNKVSGAFDQGCNSFIMCLKLLKDLEVKSISVAGADGYKEDGNNYFNTDMKSTTPHGNKYNIAVSDAIRALDVKVKFITPSEYNK